MKIKFSRNVLVYGVHRESGSIHEIKDSDAVLLISDRSASKVNEIAPQSIETAESRQSATAETATIKTRKGK